MKNDDALIKLEKRDYYCTLFDIYGKLFTDKQQTYFKDYYFEDLSLSEIAENYGISRSAVFDVISKMQSQLEEYEIKLNIDKNKENILGILYDYENKAKSENNDLTLELIEIIRRVM